MSIKDKNTIINEMVWNTADIMEANAKYHELVAEQYDSKGETGEAAYWRKDIKAMMQAVELIRKLAGCWA